MTFLLVSQFAFAEKMTNELPQTTNSDMKLVESDASTMDVSAESKEPMKMEMSGFSRGSVVRSAFTRDIGEREPMENLQKLTNDNGQVKFFTELRDMSGQTAIHRWEFEGKVVAEIEFNVKGPRWRVWSSKSFSPQWTGDWKVSVVNGAGEIISEKNLSYEVALATQEGTMTAPSVATTEESPADMQ